MKFLEFKTKGRENLNPEELQGYQQAHKEISNLRNIKSFDDFMNINVSLLTARDLHALKQDAYKELVITGYTALFEASKNQEVEPLSMNDVAQYFLKGHISTELIL